MPGLPPNQKKVEPHPLENSMKKSQHDGMTNHASAGAAARQFLKSDKDLNKSYPMDENSPKPEETHKGD